MIVGTYDSASLRKSGDFTLRAGKFATINYPGTNGVTHVNRVNNLGQLVGSYVNSTAKPVDGFFRTANGAFEHLRYPKTPQMYPASINGHYHAVCIYQYRLGWGLQEWGFIASLP